MKYFLLLTFPLLLFACEEEATRSDAYGNFEATVTMVSAQANGRLLYLNIEEGQAVTAGSLVGLVDTTSLHLQRLKLHAEINSFEKKLQTAEPDIRIFEDQKRNLIRERDRTERLVAAKAATSKQFDDLNGQLEVLDQQIAAARSRVGTTNKNVLSSRDPLVAQLDVLADQIAKAYVLNPVSGTVLTKLAEPSEIVRMSSPLYRVARLDTLVLRAYAGSIPLQRAKVGQTVEVLIDAGAENYERLAGTISWIADQAEFTPKTIQTKEERVNLVYAIKIAVPNPERKLKLGMPAEVVFGDHKQPSDVDIVTETTQQ
jgi:HlyD family secretion protein